MNCLFSNSWLESELQLVQSLTTWGRSLSGEDVLEVELSDVVVAPPSPALSLASLIICTTSSTGSEMLLQLSGHVEMDSADLIHVQGVPSGCALPLLTLNWKLNFSIQGDSGDRVPVCKRMLFRTNIRPNYSAEYSAETDMPKVTGIRYSA